MQQSNEVRYPCKTCGRQFFREVLDKHQPICAKSASNAKKRKVFDSTKQRAEGTEITYRQMKQAQKKPVEAPKSNWRAKHEDFMSTVKAARGVSKAIAEGGPLPPPPPPSINPDYIQCPYCSRRFSQTAADRHISFCKEQSQRVNNRPLPNATAKAKQDVRTQYQAPKPKAKTGSGAGSSGTGSTSMTPPSGARTPVGASGRGPAPAAGRAGGAAAPSMRGRGSYPARR